LIERVDTEVPAPEDLAMGVSVRLVLRRADIIL
jgi:hypothetical protein